MTIGAQYYFYLWKHRYVDVNDQIISRTCLGITSDPKSRVQGYEGHVGHEVQFASLWIGPERLIRDLEQRIKRDFYDYLFVGTGGFRYEWINEHIQYDNIVEWVRWEVQNTYVGISEILDVTRIVDPVQEI